MPSDTAKSINRASRNKREVAPDSTSESPAKKRHQESESSDMVKDSTDESSELTEDISTPTTSPDLSKNISVPKLTPKDVRFDYADCGYIPKSFIRSRLEPGGRTVSHELGYYHAADLYDNPSLRLDWKVNRKLLQINGQPLVVCAMVRILTVKFVESEDAVALPPRQWFRFQTLREIDQQALERLVYGKQNPRTTRQGRRSFQVGHWTTAYGSTEVKPFDNVKDAPIYISGKSNNSLPAEELAVNDIVFLEANLRRFPKSPEDMAQLEISRERGIYANGWGTSLELWRVFRMMRAPHGAPVAPDSGDEFSSIEMDDE